MSKVTPVPIEEVQNWLMIEKCLRPMLAELDVVPKDIDHVLAQVKVVFENCFLGFDWSLNVMGYKDRAKWARIKGVIEATRDFYQRVILALLYEIALRELALIRAKQSDPPRSAAEAAR